MANSILLPNSFKNHRITVCISTELLLTARTVDGALDLLKRTGFEGDCCLWDGEQLLAVHFAGAKCSGSGRRNKPWT